LLIKSAEANEKEVRFYATGQDIWLTEFVPPEFISLSDSPVTWSS
jgi:RNA:NAD 2'-phosphotransferase (TPT1/KptA family)